MSQRTDRITVGYVDRIVMVFGGVRAMARAVGRPPSTVGSWVDRGSIPDAHKPAVMAAASDLGLAIGPADFFPRLDLSKEGAA